MFFKTINQNHADGIKTQIVCLKEQHLNCMCLNIINSLFPEPLTLFLVISLLFFISMTSMANLNRKDHLFARNVTRF